MGSNPDNQDSTKTKEGDNVVVVEEEEEEEAKQDGDETKQDDDAKTQDDTNKSTATTPVPVPTTTPSQTPTPGAGIDAHPYARGSVIEALYGIKEEEHDDWFSWSSSDNDNDDDEKKKQHGDVRLCDVIDRVMDESTGKWRYYVHYRDFNRRMDEWISMDRIVSPPSVGNAKHRAMKKVEERQKRKQARREERNAEKLLATTHTVMLNAPRASRRRSVEGEGTTTTATNAATAGTAMAEGEIGTANSSTATAEAPRMTRRRNTLERSASTISNAGSIVAAATESSPTLPDDKEEVVVAIPTATTAKHQTVVGPHIVATIPAQEMDEHEGLDEQSLKEHEEVTKVKNVAFLELGPHQMETWYFSPLPKELLSERGFIEVLYACEFSLHMFARKSELLRYQARELPKNQRHPPGNEIYRCNNLSMFEVDGSEERIYCQNLCYIAKLFLDHKTLYFDVDPFLFYILCEVDNRGYHPVGYFSKEKYSDVGYNLACILTFPSQQRKGYGRFLISFSYELSKKEEKVGSPEKPMSDLGQQAYKPYWMSTIVDFLRNQQPQDDEQQQGNNNTMSIMDISKKTSIMAEDIVFTLNQLGILKIINGVYFIAAEDSLLERLAQKHPVKEPRVDATKLHWTPFVTDVKRDKFSIHSKKQSVEGDETTTRGVQQAAQAASAQAQTQQANK